MNFTNSYDYLEKIKKSDLDNLNINNELNKSTIKNNEFDTLYGILTTTTIQNQLNVSKVDITLLQNLYNGLSYFLNEINNLNIKTTGIEHTISSSITTITNKLNVNYIDYGYNDITREINSGNIIYGGGNYQNALNIYGKGSYINQRLINLWDNVQISNKLNVKYLDLGYDDITREINSGNIIYGGGNYQNALNIYGKGPAINQRLINLWDNVQIYGNLTVNGSVNFVSSLSGVVSTTSGLIQTPIIFGISTVSQLPSDNIPTVSIDNSIPSNPKLLFGIPAGTKGDKGDRGDTGPQGDSRNAERIAEAAGGVAGGAAITAAGAVKIAGDAAFVAGIASTTATNAQISVNEIAPRVRNIETNTTQFFETSFIGDVLVKGQGAPRVRLSNQVDQRSFFYQDLEVTGVLYSNDIYIHPDTRDKVFNIGGNGNNTLNLQSNEDINMRGKTKVYINSEGEIIIESGTSITLRAPKIFMEGEVIKKSSLDGPYLNSYSNDIRNIATNIDLKGNVQQVLKIFKATI